MAARQLAASQHQMQGWGYLQAGSDGCQAASSQVLEKPELGGHVGGAAVFNRQHRSLGVQPLHHHLQGF